MLQSEPLTSKPQVLQDELDRTDELPVLDVEAYEVTLRSNQQGLSRTATWAVEALRDIDEIAEARHERAEAVEEEVSQRARAGALTANVDSILKRIAELEANIVTAHEANDALRKRNEEGETEREHLHKRLQALGAENARVNEARELAKEVSERAEHKLREQLEAAVKQVQALTTARDDANARIEDERSQRSVQLKELNAARAQLEEQVANLQKELRASQALAAQREQSVLGLESALDQENLLKAQLSRQFAAKLTDYDKLASILDLRDQAVQALLGERTALQRQLDEAAATIIGLSRELEAVREQATAETALHEERAAMLADHQLLVQTLNATIMELQRSLEDLQLRAVSSQEELSNVAAARQLEEKRSLDLAAQLAVRTSELEQARIAGEQWRSQLEVSQAAAEMHVGTLEEERVVLSSVRAQAEEQARELMKRDAELQHLREEIDEVRRSSRSSIDQLTQERDALVPASDVLKTKQGELNERLAEIGQLRDELVAAHAGAQDQIRALTEQCDGLMPAADQLAERTAELSQLQEEVTQLREALVATHASTQETRRLLQEKTEEIAALDGKVREDAMAIRELEVAILARDSLAQELRGELQTARDERAIVAGQLEKARRRVKSLSEEIFKRDHEIAELRTDLGVHSEALAAIRRDVNRIGRDSDVEPTSEPERFLEPLEHDGPAITLTAKIVTIGRTTETDVCLPSKLVSRNHARLLVGPTGVIVEDAGSTNGCFVNGKQVRKHLMHEGDVLEIGDFRYQLRTKSTQDTRVRANVVPFDKPPT